MVQNLSHYQTKIDDKRSQSSFFIAYRINYDDKHSIYRLQNIIADCMKSNQHIKPKIRLQNAKIKTARMIEMQLKKEEFFEQVMKHLHQQFSQKDLEFLLQNIEIVHYQDRKPNNHHYKVKDDKRSSLTCATQIQKDNFPNQISQEPKKENLNPFQSFYNQFLLKNKANVPKEMKKHSCTPVRASLDIKRRFPFKFFEVDEKMRKNYSRIKQRMVFNSPEDTFRATNLIRNSEVIQRQSKTQRAKRYPTTCADSQNRTQEYSIPPMLLGELLQRQSYQQQMPKSLKNQQKKQLCFRRNESSFDGFRRKYRFNL